MFAPTNEAFAKVPPATLAHLLDPANIGELDSVLTYHVLPEAVQSKDLKPFQSVKTVEGQSLQIVASGGSVFVNNAQVTAADNEASNGVVHIINRVLIPPVTPTPAPAPKNHLWFYHIGSIDRRPYTLRCGEVDAAERMPASIFEPSHILQLELYEKVTIEGWGNGNMLKLGRCGEIGYTVPAGSQIIDWDAGVDMNKICRAMCNCFWGGGFCRNQTKDDPANNRFCSRLFAATVTTGK